MGAVQKRRDGVLRAFPAIAGLCGGFGLVPSCDIFAFSRSFLYCRCAKSAP